MATTAATLFSGIGAPETAMPEWHWPWSAEIDRFASAVLAARHPESTNLGDVSAHDFCERAAAIARPDVIVFGSPCQSYSVAGKRLGLDDPRGNLALVALGIIDRLEPDWFVFENVPGLLSSSEGCDFGIFLRTVDELGYSGAWASLDAQYFGVAQRRERLFFVGHSGDWRRAAAVLLEPESLCGHHPPSREAGEKPAPTIASRPTGGGGLGTDFDCDGGLIAHCFDARQSDVIQYGDKTGPLDTDGHTHAIAFDTTQVTSKANRSQPREGDPCHPLAAGAHPPAIAFSCKDHGADAGQVAVAFALGSHAGAADADQSNRSHTSGGPVGSNISENLSYSLRGGRTQAVATSSVRRLTPAECEALQGFPRGYTNITYRGKPAADGPRYKALGNSMAVPVMRWILSRIEIANKS